MSNKKYSKLSEDILKVLGGAENIALAYHCATRLRFGLKDWNQLREDQLDKLPGVLGHRIANEQLQIIIGSHVSEVYDQLCEIAGISPDSAENAAAQSRMDRQQLPIRILNAISGCIIPLIPVIVAGSLLKMIATALGPGMLNLISDGSDLYRLFLFAGDAAFYFLPIFIGFTASRQFHVTPVLGMLMAAIMVHPTLVSIVQAGEAFTVYGIPMTLVSYGSSTLPIVLIVWILSYVEWLFRKIIPNSLRMVFVPLLTVIVMLPVALCLVGPLGSWLGTAFTDGMVAFGGLGVAAAVIVSALSGALWNVLVLLGMHLTFYFAYINIFLATGSDSLIGPGTSAATIAVAGMAFGAMLRMKGKNRNLAASYFVAQVIGAVTEPSIFGIGIRYKKPFIGAVLGGMAGAVYYAVTKTAILTMAASANFLVFTGFAGGSVTNLVNGFIGGGIAFAVAALFTYFFGFTKEELQTEDDAEIL